MAVLGCASDGEGRASQMYLVVRVGFPHTDQEVFAPKRRHVEKLGIEVGEVLLGINLGELHARWTRRGERKPILDVRRCDAVLIAVSTPC